MTIFAVPPGIVADASAAWGLFGFMSNANVGTGVARITTAGTSTTLTPAQSVVGAIILAAGASGGFTINFPSTAALLLAMGETIPIDGSFMYLLAIKNNAVGQTGTVTAGDASTTVTGTATIATNTTRLFAVIATSATTVTIENLGSLSL